MIEQTSEKDIKQKQDNHNDEEIEIDWTETLHKIIDIRKTIYKAAGIGLVIGIIVAISIPNNIQSELLFLLKWEVLKAVVYPVWRLLFWEVEFL